MAVHKDCYSAIDLTQQDGPHRRETQVAGWLHDKLKIEVSEYGLEGCGCGWSHPKLFAKLRK
jgi:hypothetical protein